VARLALGLEYDGSAFSGWQTQADGSGVQDAVEQALGRFAGVTLTTVCAGRTDAGVHATAQVIHFDTEILRPLQSWQRGVNRWLPPAVAVRWAREVDETFHARFGALDRRYDYWLLDDPVRSPLAAGRVGWVFRPLDADAMARAAGGLVGTHDFTSFRAAECQAATPMRDVRELSVQRFGRLVRVRIRANAYLHHMVRNIVGSLVYVGVGRQPESWLAGVLAARSRAVAAPTFTGAGLYLTDVAYDPRFDLPAGREALLPVA
jgi:tRNA pseudouridine38-40 synthase